VIQKLARPIKNGVLANEHYLDGYGAPTGTETNGDNLNQPYNIGYGEAFNYVAASGLATNHGPSNPSQLQCWTCHADNWAECMDTGMLRHCEPHVTSCQAEFKIAFNPRNGGGEKI